ncbi:Uncharacterized conserved protein, DUF362 family [Caloramator fervidus]|uniref:Uncharacterized conserved protein, DUF362 family n=1 Tax=Caloramator fervidus TaxID=29344 RepID=A0A1H5SIP8_9CLOT|nr:DUF362 domain-containing protein [Caloramator fervidus]SEF50499.1 Uncharacterized conserved protein, DUF362 family [Caloramator fervidus]
MERVFLSRCETYKKDEVYKAVDKIFQLAGGIDKIANKGEKIFLKINLVIKKHPDDAATTHPMIVEAVAKMLVEHGCQVIIGDSPGGPYNERVLKSLYKVCGIEDAAKNAGAKLNFDCSTSDYKTVGGCIIKKLNMIKPPFECDKIITISKLKTHSMALYTGAVKVLFGMIPGIFKAEYHLKMPDIKDFSNLLVDICETVKPYFSIIDGVVGMEGDGPTAGVPKKTGLILASFNPYYLDVAGAYVMGISPKDVPTIQRCIERNLCSGKIEDIEFLGENINDFVIKYKIPNTKSVNFFRGRVPKKVEEFLTYYLSPRPIFDYNICVGCKRCYEVCPPKAIKIENNKPHVNYKSCIRCFCCHELCPKKAVKIHRNRIISRFLK